MDGSQDLGSRHRTRNCAVTKSAQSEETKRSDAAAEHQIGQSGNETR